MYLSYLLRVNTIRLNVLCLFVLLSINSHAQDALYLAPGANLFIKADTLGLYSSVINGGNFGSSNYSVVRMMGLQWMNDSTASLPDENSYISNSSIPFSFGGNGGIFWFDNSVTSSPAFGQIQFIAGGYAINNHSGPSFSNLQIDNTSGVWLSSVNTDLSVLNNLNFKNGKLFLNNNNILIGNDLGPGNITNYTDQKYIVTGNTITGGSVYRSKINELAGQIVFPIGADTNYYTPASVLYKGTAQYFRVRSFNQILSNAISGTNGDANFVTTTWNIGKENNEVAELSLSLQHPHQLEGIGYAALRDQSFITRFNPIQNAWDSTPGSAPSFPGNLTTGIQLNNTYVNTRIFTTALSPNEYLSSSVLKPDSKLGLSKQVDEVKLLPDGTFDVAFTFIVQSHYQSDLIHLLVSDNLINTFTNAISIRVISIGVTGLTLIVNPNYTGVGADTMMLQSSSWLASQQADTIHLHLNVDTHKMSGVFYNSALATAFSDGFVFDATSANGNMPFANPSKSPILLNYLTHIHIPGGFSPNNDGVNDRFVIENTILYNIKMELINRWGTKVYDSKGYYQNDWDGICNQPGPLFNNRLESGTYYYIIQVFDKQTNVLVEKAIGFITLNR